MTHPMFGILALTADQSCDGAAAAAEGCEVTA
jgi:hypothetical protein